VLLYDHVLLVNIGSLCTLSSTGESATGSGGAFILFIGNHITINSGYKRAHRSQLIQHVIASAVASSSET
jgi:hypothetical protein